MRAGLRTPRYSLNPRVEPPAKMAGRTLYDKIWDDHLVSNNEDGTSLIYIDRHLVHEVTSPQAFEGLRMNGLSLIHI